MKARTKKAPTVTVTLTRSEAEEIHRALGKASPVGALYSLYFVLDDIVDCEKTASEHTS